MSCSLFLKTTSAERDFSYHCIVKNELRNAMHVMTLDSPMRVHEHVDIDSICTTDLTQAENYRRNPPALWIRKLFEATHDLVRVMQAIQRFEAEKAGFWCPL